MLWKKDKPTVERNYTALLHAINATQETEYEREQYYFPELPAGVAPEGHVLAMDSMCQQMAGYAGLEPQFYSGFLGYPRLAQMAQSSEYRAVAETTAEEMTREWGKVKGNDHERVEAIEEELERLNVRDLMRKHVETDHLYGGSQMFIRIKGQEDKANLPLLLTPKGVKKGSLEGFTVIEPIWTTPSVYNATDPTLPDFFKPSQWFVMGRDTHCDRLMTLVMRPVPDMLKPAYNFRGVSMSQLMKPYVERFQRTVDSVSDLVHSYSITGLKTDMSSILSGGQNGANQLIARAKIFTQFKNNQNLMITDTSNEEEFFQLNTPLSTLDALQDQSLQMLAMPAKIPLVKLLGTPPSGLSANSDGEIRVYYDHIAALQNGHLLPQMQVILKLVQLSLFGDIDESIFFQFNPLYQLDDVQKATVNLTKAQTADLYMQAGVLDQETVLDVLSNDEDGDYTGKADSVVVDRYAEEETEDEEKAPL